MIIKDIIHIFASISENICILLTGRRFQFFLQRWYEFYKKYMEMGLVDMLKIWLN